MKVLLDECIPRKLKSAFAEHDCMTVPEAGLAGKKNGVLLSLAEGAGFDIFLTLDKGIQYQQSMEGRSIAVLIVRAKSNRIQDLLPHVEACRVIVRSIQHGEVVRVGA
jgi:hypothetical protein